MASLLVIRRILALTLAVTLATMGVPVPVNASGEQEQPSARKSVLTLNGQPIQQFVSTTRHSRGAVLFSRLIQAQPSNGQISGVALAREGQPLAGQTVQLSRPSGGRLNATTDQQGQFSFTGLGPGTYEVELSVFDRVIASSGPVELSEGAMVVSGVTVSLQRKGMGRGAKIAIIGVGIGVGVIVLTYVALCGGRCGG